MKSLLVLIFSLLFSGMSLAASPEMVQYVKNHPGKARIEVIGFTLPGKQGSWIDAYKQAYRAKTNLIHETGLRSDQVRISTGVANVRGVVAVLETHQN